MTTATVLPSAARVFLLVHGAWHGGWCWDRVSRRLQADGHRVLAPCLSGLGSSPPSALQRVSLQTHVDDVLQLIAAERLADFVLVGHSYAGIIVSGVADALRERIAHCVYLDAAVPPDMSAGASVGWSDFYTPAERAARIASAPDFAIAPPAPAAFGVTEPDDVALLRARLAPMPLRTFTGRITFRNGGSEGLRRTYVAHVRPPYPPLAATYRHVIGAAGWNWRELAAGHDAMITAPDAVAGLLASI